MRHTNFKSAKVTDLHEYDVNKNKQQEGKISLKIWSEWRMPVFLHSKLKRAIALEILQKDLVAQLVEQYTFNVWALGSSPSQITSWDRFENKEFVPFFLLFKALLIKQLRVIASLTLAARY